LLEKSKKQMEELRTIQETYAKKEAELKKEIEELRKKR
jgi:hypothetical protein